MIFTKLPDFVVDKSLVQSPAGRQQILDACQEAELELAQHPVVMTFSCDYGNDILLLRAALDEIDRLQESRPVECPVCGSVEFIWKDNEYNVTAPTEEMIREMEDGYEGRHGNGGSY